LGPHRCLHPSRLGFGTVGQALVQALTGRRTARRRALLERGNGATGVLGFRSCSGPRCRRLGTCLRWEGAGPARRRSDVPARRAVLFCFGQVAIRRGCCIRSARRLRGWGLPVRWGLSRGRFVVRDAGHARVGLDRCRWLGAHVGFGPDHPRARRLFYSPGPGVVRSVQF